MQSGELSINVTYLAPLLKASIPMLPDPANKSNTSAFSKENCKVLKIPSLAIPIIGRVAVSLIVSMFLPL